MLRFIVSLCLPLIFGLLGLCCAGVILTVSPPSRAMSNITVREYSLPHHIPKCLGNVTFRFVMAHDVIHERFPHHGPAYYEARNREVERDLEEFKPRAAGDEAQRYFRLLDTVPLRA